jgi:hypothetical protein
MSAFEHRAAGFGTLDIPPPYSRRSIGPISLHNAIFEAIGRGMKKGEAAYLFGVSLSSVKFLTLERSLPSSAQG